MFTKAIVQDAFFALFSHQSIMVQWLAFLLHIQEFLGSNFGLTKVYSGFPQSQQENAETVP
jgi:hypothetical protein